MADIIADRHNMSIVNRTQDGASLIATWQYGAMTFGTRLRETRKARGLRGIVLAEMAGVDGSSISRWENGGRKSPGAVEVAKLAKALGVNERWLLTGEGPREPGPVALETPVGASALEQVLFSYDWPDVPIELVDEITETLRVEAQTNGGRTRSASAWRLRIGQVLRERTSKRRVSSRPKIRAITGGSR